MGRQELRAIISADSRRFNRTMGEVKRTAKRTAGAIAGLGVVGIIKATKAAGIFEKQLAEIGTLGAFSQKELDGVGKSLLKLSTELGATTEELTGGLYQALSAGVGKDDVFDFLTTAVKASRAGVTDTKTAVDGITNVLNAYKLEASDAGRISDLMFETVKRGKTTFGELAGNIGNVASISATAGVSTEQLLAAYASLTKKGIDTATSTTLIKAAITSLTSPSEELKNTFKKLGIESGTAAIKQHGLQGALALLADEAGNTNEGVGRLFTNVRGSAAVLALTGGNAKIAAEDLAGMAGSAGAANAAFEIMNTTGAADFDRSMAIIGAAAIKVGSKTLPILTEEMKNLNEALATPEGDQALRDIGDTAAGLLEIIKSLVSGVRELSELLQLPEVGDFLGGGFGFQRDALDVAGSAVTPEQIAAYKQIKQSGALLEGGQSAQSIIQAKIAEDFLRAGSTGSILILQNIQKILDGRLPSDTAGATQ